MVAASSHVPFFLGAEYPNGYMAECYFLFLQEQTKDIIIKGNFRLPEPRFKIFAVVPSFRRILKKTNHALPTPGVEGDSGGHVL
jgi:hypothetical protein